MKNRMMLLKVTHACVVLGTSNNLVATFFYSCKFSERKGLHYLLIPSNYTYFDTYQLR